MIMTVASLALPNGSAFALELGQSATVIASRCNLYKNADFSSEKVMTTTEQESVEYFLQHNDVVDVLEIENDFALVETTDEIEGWVYKYYLTQNSSQTVYPVFNATIRNDSVIYDMDLNESGFEVKKNQRVYVYKSYSEKENYTAVQVVLEDQSLYNGYVLTKNVNPDGISGLLISAISIIIAGVTIVLSIVFIKKKKKKN